MAEKMLQERYQDTLYFMLQEKREDILCVRDRTSNILRGHHSNVQLGDEKTQIIKTALKYIYNDTITIDLDTKSYPSAHSMSDITSQLVLVPDSLQLFLRPILKTDERVAIWGQNFIKACRPQSVVLKGDLQPLLKALYFLVRTLFCSVPFWILLPLVIMLS